MSQSYRMATCTPSSKETRTLWKASSTCNPELVPRWHNSSSVRSCLGTVCFSDFTNSGYTANIN